MDESHFMNKEEMEVKIEMLAKAVAGLITISEQQSNLINKLNSTINNINNTIVNLIECDRLISKRLDLVQERDSTRH